METHRTMKVIKRNKKAVVPLESCPVPASGTNVRDVSSPLDLLETIRKTLGVDTDSDILPKINELKREVILTEKPKILFTKYVELADIDDTEKEVHRRLVEEITGKLRERMMAGDSAGWESLKTKRGGKTQDSENIAKQYLREVLNLMGLSYEEPSSQKPYDFRNVGKNVGIRGLWIELKKTDSMTVCLNDTLPHPNSWYIFMLTKTKRVAFLGGNEMITMGRKRDGDICAFESIEEYYVNNLSIRVYSKKCGAFKMCSRSNMSFDVSCLM
jgi:hypothetical protein